jgi:photosystem II stability/assembly factor-like uncharacterized protein
MGTVQAGPAQTAVIAHTSDAGGTWSKFSMPVPFGYQWLGGNMDFVDPLHGWAAFHEGSGSAFSHGDLFGTTDGGITWTPLSMPFGGQIHFTNWTDGFLVGGVIDNQLAFTHDGGKTWTSSHLPTSVVGTPNEYATSLPVFSDPQHATMSAASAGLGGASAAFLTTSDGGRTWAVAAIKNAADSNNTPAAAVIDASTWIVNFGPDWYGTSDRGQSWAHWTTAGLESALSMQFSDMTTGWAIKLDGSCNSDVCTQSTTLLFTTDVARTWTPLNPP